MASTSGIRAGRAFVELGVNDKLTAGLKKAQAQLRAFGDGVKAIGVEMVKVSAAVAAPFAASTMVFAGFEQEMARVRALTGATGDDFAALEKEARRLGEMTVFSARQAAEAMSFFALAGFDVQKILKSVGPALNLAAAGQIEIAQAADITAKIMAGMGIEAEKVGNAVDVLTKAMTTANTDLVQLGDAMKYVGPIAKQAGISFEEITSAIQLLSNAGIQGQMAGTTLRGSLLSLTDPSEKAIGLMRQLGIEVKDAAGNVLPLADIISQFERAFAGMGTAERLGIIGGIFDARQAAGFAELISQGGERLRQFTKTLKQSGGTAQRIADTQINTLSGTAEILKSALEELGISIGKSIVGPLRATLTLITKAVTVAAEWVKANQKVVLAVGAAAVGIGALGASLITFGIMSKLAGFAIGVVISSMAALKVAVSSVAVVLGAIASPIGIAVAAFGLLGAAALNGSGIAGDAIEWLKKQFRTLSGTVGEVMQAITSALAGGDVEAAAGVMWASLRLAWESGISALNRIWIEAQRFSLIAFEGLRSGTLAVAQDMWHDLQTGWIETTSFISKVQERLASFLALSWETIKNIAIKTWNHIKGLFDSDFNVEQANAAADMALVAAEQRIESQKDAALAEIEQSRKSRRDQALKENEAALARIGQAFDDRVNALNEAAGERIAAAREALDGAKKRLDDAIKEARKNVGQPNQAEAPNKANPLQAALAGLAGATGRISSIVTLGGSRLSGLAQDPESKKQTDHLAAIRKGIDRMVRRQEVFA